jgi:hypothetical protein
MPLIPFPYKLLTIVIFLIASHLYTYYVGKDIGLEVYKEFRVAVEAENVKLKMQNDLLSSARKQQSDKLEEQYNNAITSLSGSSQSRLNGLQLQASRCSRTVSGASETTKLTNAATSDTGFNPNPLEATYNRLESDCAKTTMNHIYLQDWVTNVCLHTTSH